MREGFTIMRQGFELMDAKIDAVDKKIDDKVELLQEGIFTSDEKKSLLDTVKLINDRWADAEGLPTLSQKGHWHGKTIQRLVL